MNIRKMEHIECNKTTTTYKQDKYRYMSNIQLKMLDITNIHSKCALLSPRQSGKSIFLIMSAVLCNNNKVVIATQNTSLLKHLLSITLTFLKTNNITYTHNTHTITIGRKKIVFISIEHLSNNKQYYLDHDVYIDEYNMMSVVNYDFLELYKKVILIGTQRLIDIKLPNDIKVIQVKE